MAEHGASAFVGGGMKLPHTVAIERSTAGAVDDYNQPSQTFAVIATVPAFIQPKSGFELAQVNDAGPVKGRYTIFMRPTDVTEGDHLVRDTPAEVYELVFVADAAGYGHHLEIDAERVWP